MDKKPLVLFFSVFCVFFLDVQAAEVQKPSRGKITATAEEAKLLQQVRELKETEPEQAAALLTEKLKEKRSAVLVFELAVIRTTLGKTEEALELFREAASLHDPFPDAYKNIGRLEAALGNYERAIEALRKGIRQGGPDFSSSSLLGQCCVALGRWFRAEFPLKLALMAEPENGKLQLYLAEALYGQGRYRECEKNVQIALKGAPLDRKLWTLLANARIAGSRTSEAIDALEACVCLDIDVDHRLLWTLGDLYVNDGLYGSAVKSYNRALEKGEPDRTSLRNVVLAFHGAQQTEKARSFAQLFLDRFGQQVDVLLVLGEIALRDNKVKDAAGWFKKAAAADPLSGRALILCAEAALIQEKDEEALSYYRTLRELTDYKEQALRGEVSVLLENDRLEEALKVLQQLNRLSPERAWRDLIHAVQERLREEK